MNAGLLVVGNGNLAKAIRDFCEKQKTPCYRLGDQDTISRAARMTVAVHCGSGNEMPRLLETASRNNIPIIQASGGLPNPEENSLKVPFIVAANLALPIVKLLSGGIFSLRKNLPLEMKAVVKESHQATKKAVPATAQKMAQLVGVPIIEINSIRDPGLQALLGVPTEHLGGHAFHWITWKGLGVEVELSTRVLGREAYAAGALVIADALVAKEANLWPDQVYYLENVLSELGL